MGRFMSPDWSAKSEAVPYSDLMNPQSLNLYGYEGNNPLSKADADGHCWPICSLIAPVATWLFTHPSVGEAFSKIGSGTSVTARGGVGIAGDVKGVKGEASATVYVKSSEKGISVGVDGKAGAKIAGVGGEATGNVPIVKDGQFANPVKGANLSGSGNISGDVGKGNVGGSANPEEVSVGGTYGEGVVAGGEVSNSGVGGFLHAVGNALVDDIKDKVNQVNQAIDKIKNPN